MELCDVAAFVEVAEQGSLAAAAALMFVSQPTLTRRLQRLERALGVRLYTGRGRGGVLITPAGRYWLRYASEIIATVTTAEQALEWSTGTQYRSPTSRASMREPDPRDREAN